MKFPMDRPVKVVMLGAGGTGGYPDRKRLCEVKSILRQAHPAGDGRHS